MRSRLWLLMVAGAALGGCSGLQSPRASVGEAIVTEATSEGARIEMPLVLQNPNRTPLPIRETQYTIEVDGQTFEFADRSAATMPAQGVQTVQMPAAFATPAGSLDGRSYVVRGRVTYEPPGEVRKVLTDSGIPLPSVGFESSGVLAAPAAQ